MCSFHDSMQASDHRQKIQGYKAVYTLLLNSGTVFFTFHYLKYAWWSQRTMHMTSGGYHGNIAALVIHVHAGWKEQGTYNEAREGFWEYVYEGFGIIVIDQHLWTKRY